MRIAFVLEREPLPETDDVTGLLADALVRRGHEVHVAGAERPPWVRGGRLAEWKEQPEAHYDRLIRWSAGVPLLLVEDDLYRDKPRREATPLRVLLAGAIETEVLGIDDGYGAVAHARWFHQKLDLVRASPWAPSRGEPLDQVQEFHVGLNGAEMTRLIHSCDVVVVPALSEAGYSLLAAEAMAAQLPCVMTATRAHMAQARDAAHLGPEQNAVELGERLIEVLQDEELRETLRKRGREIAEEWRCDVVAERFEKTLT